MIPNVGRGKSASRPVKTQYPKLVKLRIYSKDDSFSIFAKKVSIA